MLNKIQIPALLIFILSSFISHAQYDTTLIVAQDGSGEYTTIQAALNATKAFPDQAITIHIKKGEYKEKVRVYPWNTNLSLIGEDRENTIVIFDDHFKKMNLGRNSTFHTATFSVEANDVTLKNLTIVNAAGPVGQAVALSVSGDRCVIENCTLMGCQDTLYCTGESSRQYFVDCHIEGTVDFIIGSATVLFEDCVIHSKSNAYITAASTTQRQSYGFVFRDCQLTAADGVNEVYLGRPWRIFAKTVFIDCQYGDHILPVGWDDWGKPVTHQTAFYAEFTNTNTSERVKWSKQLSKKKAKRYTKANIFPDWVFSSK